MSCGLYGRTLTFPLFLHDFKCIVVTVYFVATLSHMPFRGFFRTISIRTFIDTDFKKTLNSTILKQILGMIVRGGIVLLNDALSTLRPRTDRVPLKRLCTTLRRRTLVISVGRLCK